MAPKVVVTGLGIITPIGTGLNKFWNAAIEGHSGISKIPSFKNLEIDAYRSQIAGQIHGFDPLKFIDEKYATRVDRYAQFALVAAKEALEDAGVQMERENSDRVGVMVGAGMGGMMMGEREISQLYDTKKPNRIHPNFIPTITLNSASGIIAMLFGARGPNITISTACSSSIHAIGQALNTCLLYTSDAADE